MKLHTCTLLSERTTTLTSTICSTCNVNDSVSLGNFEQISHTLLTLIATNVFGRKEVSLSLPSRYLRVQS